MNDAVGSKPKSRMSYRRIIVPSALAVAVVAYAIDLRARHKAQAAYDIIKAAADRNASPQDRKILDRAEVERLLGRQGDEDEDLRDNEQRYGWQGAFRRHTLYVMYNLRTDEVYDFSLNQAPK